MIFCKQASVEDCIYYIPNMKYIKSNCRGFRFGRRLRFKREEVQGNLAWISAEARDFDKAERL